MISVNDIALFDFLPFPCSRAENDPDSNGSNYAFGLSEKRYPLGNQWLHNLGSFESNSAGRNRQKGQPMVNGSLFHLTASLGPCSVSSHGPIPPVSLRGQPTNQNIAWKGDAGSAMVPARSSVGDECQNQSQCSRNVVHDLCERFVDILAVLVPHLI
jgi:hypothetical protein